MDSSTRRTIDNYIQLNYTPYQMRGLLLDSIELVSFIFDDLEDDDEFDFGSLTRPISDYLRKFGIE